MIGTFILGEREEKRKKKDREKYGNIPMMVLGMLILWFGWYGLNAGSEFNINKLNTIPKIIVNMTVSAGACGVSTAEDLLLNIEMIKKFNIFKAYFPKFDSMKGRI